MRLGLHLGLGPRYGGGGPVDYLTGSEMIVVAGQSQSLAQGVSGVPPAVAAIDSARVKIWNGSSFVGYIAGTNAEPTGAYGPGLWGPEAGYAIDWLAGHPTGTLYIVKRGYSGTAIAGWLPGQSLFDSVTDWLDAAKLVLAAAEVPYDTDISVLWCQGASDALGDQALAEAYRAKLVTCFAGMRSEWGTAATKIASERAYYTNLTYGTIIRAAQNAVAYADPLAYLVDSDDFTLVDAYHYNNAGIIELGSRMYDSVTSGASIEVDLSTTWNAADKASPITLSNGGLTFTTDASGHQGVRGTAGHNSGKRYFEVTCNQTGPFGGFGISNAGASLTIFLGSTIDAAVYYDDGNAYYGGSALGAAGAYAASDVLSVAVDIDADRVWFAKNGSFSGDPVAGTGGISVPGIGAPVYPIGGTYAGGVAIQTANFGASAFSYSPPTGFASWNTP